MLKWRDKSFKQIKLFRESQMVKTTDSLSFSQRPTEIESFSKNASALQSSFIFLNGASVILAHLRTILVLFSMGLQGNVQTEVFQGVEFSKSLDHILHSNVSHFITILKFQGDILQRNEAQQIFAQTLHSRICCFLTTFYM